MGARKKVQLPYEVLINGNARMWYSIFKAMKRKEFVEYPQRIRSFDDMTVAEYYAYKRVARAREDDKIWEQIQKTTEGYPATQGTIQQDKTQMANYCQELAQEEKRKEMTKEDTEASHWKRRKERSMLRTKRKTILLNR